MQLIEITDPKEAQRCRVAQYRSQKATVMFNGAPVTGMVGRVQEHQAETPVRWTIALVPGTRIGQSGR
jgi:CRISPR/Cas system endoribonuclease Cas6 (RAMP superfamily)